MTGYLVSREREREYGDELSHHGILGQKWGVRRYQNEDGSLTPAGEKRYDNAEGMASRGFGTSANKRVNQANQAAAKAFSNSTYWKSVKKAENTLDKTSKAANRTAQKLHNSQEATKENPDYWRMYNQATGEYEETDEDELDEKEQQRLEQLYQKQSAADDEAYEAYDDAVKKTVTDRSITSLAKEASAYISAGLAFVSSYIKNK